MTYALARETALKTVYPGAADILTPNNILALEYINAIHRQKAPFIPVTIARHKTGYHDLSLTEDNMFGHSAQTCKKWDTDFFKIYAAGISGTL